MILKGVYMYTFDDIIKIGSKEVIRQKAKFKEVDLYCWNGKYGLTTIGNETYKTKPYEGVFFGLYQMFTEETQHTYGTEDDLLFILGAIKLVIDNKVSDHNLPPKEVYEQGISDTVSYMKRIANQYNVTIINDDYNKVYDEIEKSEWFNPCNYFSWYRNGRYDYYNLLRLLKENKLLTI
jgi:hypothetical protein